MFTENYIAALLVDEGLADEVWELWNPGIISVDLAATAWCILACDFKPSWCGDEEIN